MACMEIKNLTFAYPGRGEKPALNGVSMTVRPGEFIVLCGRSGSGKGYVAKKFAAYGIPSVDTDAVYRTMTAPAALYSPCMQELVAAFGEGLANPDHSLNRRALADIVFAEGASEALVTLNRITHVHILRETVHIAEQLAAGGALAVLVDAPVLFESGFDAHCDCTLCVVAPEEVSVARIVKRDGITEAEARRRLASQISAEELVRRCDYVIENGYHCDTLEMQVASVVQAVFDRFEIVESADE